MVRNAKSACNARYASCSTQCDDAWQTCMDNRQDDDSKACTDEKHYCKLSCDSIASGCRNDCDAACDSAFYDDDARRDSCRQAC